MQPKLPRASDTREAIGHALDQREGLIRFLTDRRIEMDNDTARARHEAVNPAKKQNALFA